MSWLSLRSAHPILPLDPDGQTTFMSAECSTIWCSFVRISWQMFRGHQQLTSWPRSKDSGLLVPLDFLVLLASKSPEPGLDSLSESESEYKSRLAGTLRIWAQESRDSRFGLATAWNCCRWRCHFGRRPRVLEPAASASCVSRSKCALYTLWAKLRVPIIPIVIFR